MTKVKPITQQILNYGILAPSSHNSQPWKVRIEENILKVYGDFNRKLTFVDPINREFLLSLSAFIETINIAASAVGQQIEIQTNLNPISESKELFVLEFKDSPKISDNTTLSLIEKRFTDRKNYETTELKSSDINTLQSLDKENVHYFPANSIQGESIAELQILAFKKQSQDKNKQSELSDWLRFDKGQKAEIGDGIFPEMLGLRGLPKFVWYNFFNKKSVLSNSFINRGIKGAEEQVKHTGGFLVISSGNEENVSLYNAGRLYQRVLLKCTELEIRNHTISQILEEEPMKNQIGNNLGLQTPLQFIIRLGYSNKKGYGKHIRRPVSSVLL